VNTVESLLDAEVVGVRPLHGGCVSEVALCDTADGRALVVKVDRSRTGALQDEEAMLRFLRERTRLPVPAVVACAQGQPPQPDLLVTEFIPNGGALRADGERHAAELLAELHSLAPDPPRERSFGFAGPTRIGGLVQPCDWAPSWVEFFADRRLRAMAHEAHRSGRLPSELVRAVEDLSTRLERWLREPDRPSLVHGDVWSGNVLVSPAGGAVAAFVDPAISFAHAEVELAFITLFGTFGDDFFERYAEIRPIEPGFFEERRHLYNLYPLLVHCRLFGGGYIDSVASILRRFGA